MTTQDVIAAIQPLLTALTVKMAPDALAVYCESFVDLHPADLDDAIAAMRRSHAYHTAPPPAKLHAAAQDAKRRRLAAQTTPDRPVASPAGAGEVREHTIPGLGTIRLRVLPDDHPSLPRYCCPVCHDSGWAPRATLLFSGVEYAQVARCSCHPAAGGSNPVIVRRLTEAGIMAHAHETR